MIPKKIHYCWYGGKKMPPLVRQCIASWKKFCPDYELICWNEENTDFGANLFLQEAYERKKWAFVTDVMRLMAVYEYGGIYLDTDVELLKPLDDLLSQKAFFAKETDARVSTGLGFGAEQHNRVVGLLLQEYKNGGFVLENGQFDQTSCPKKNTKVLRALGMKDGCEVQYLDDCVIYPTEYFCPKKYESKEINITGNTYSIHYFRGSWVPFEYKVKKAAVKIFGNFGYRMIKVYDRIKWGI